MPVLSVVQANCKKLLSLFPHYENGFAQISRMDTEDKECINFTWDSVYKLILLWTFFESQIILFMSSKC